MKRIEVDPSDVRVVVSETHAYGVPPPQPGAPLPFLRRHRTKIALAIAIAEMIALGFGDYLHAWIGLLAVAVAAVFIQVVIGRYLPDSVRQITWMIAFAQALVALVPIFFGVGIVVVVILLIFAVLAGVALLLADRR